MKIETFEKAAKIQDNLQKIQNLIDGLRVERDFENTYMQILFEEKGKDRHSCYLIPACIAEEICTQIRQSLEYHASQLTNLFLRL